MEKNKIGFLILCIMLFLGMQPTLSQELHPAAPKIKNSLAKRLAAEASSISYRSVNNFLLSDDKTNTHEFIVLQYVNNWVGEGFFAVNRWTGVVWDIWACEKVSTPKSDRSRLKIRKWFTPEELKQYDQLDSIRPICVDDRYRGDMHEDQ